MASSHGTLTTSLTGANNDMVFTARFPGPQSALLKVAYLDPGEETAAESIAFDYDEDTGITTVNITLRSVSAVLSTADEVKTAWEANPLCADLATLAASGGDTLATSVIAMTAAAFSAGVADATLQGYDDADEMEDDGWMLSDWEAANGDVIYAGEILVNGKPIQILSGSSNGRLKATFQYKRQFLSKRGSGGVMAFNGAGTVD